ncbi:hypothetical protein BDBG_03354 [Blastomyces gilchristii SLH14081]|uniref:Uncharacterized protein n=1 Tax=Blastomyces gilchristii (strain SLH14081) TaxID=559298 RepID=A0A179UH11_BLAGS|nr:uncharacterized protein BDBG_03354 [Blastomyces gilchristii SLH14081]OAT07274.1 hypothetical protein BDBG_03354 [Blastomyces gilchristii SLH14081]
MAGMDLGEFTLFRPDAILQRRDIRTTFSSWDNCMAKSYCKRPHIDWGTLEHNRVRLLRLHML